MAGHHSYVTGGNGLAEHFGPPDHFSDRLGADTTETCNVYNMLKLTHQLFTWKAEARLADFYERALYNHILSTQHPDDGRVIYNLSLEMGGRKQYETLFDSFTCCVGTGMENHAQYGSSIYFHSADALVVNLFAASEVTWADKGITVRQDTRFPDEDTTRLHFTTPRRHAAHAADSPSRVGAVARGDGERPVGAGDLRPLVLRRRHPHLGRWRCRDGARRR